MGDRHIHSQVCNCSREAKALGDLVSLYPSIDLENVRFFNAKGRAHGRDCFKPYDQRLDDAKSVMSEEKSVAELVFVVPFTSNVKLKTFCVRGGGRGFPGKLKIWVNRDDLDWSSLDSVPATQEWNLVDDPQAEIYYVTKIFKFNNVSCFTCHFSQSSDDRELQINYFGLMGETTNQKRQVVNVVYEARANPADHNKMEEKAGMSNSV